MNIIKHKFVEFIPEHPEEGILYISMEYSTAVHKCCCGCGNEVVTPLSPTDWQLHFDGKGVTLFPSIGNWNFACQSHYWIIHNCIVKARTWSQEEITEGRYLDQQEKKSYYKRKGKK